jgi:hypothetical protein
MRSLELNKNTKKVTVKSLCEESGISRQGYYKSYNKRIKQEIDELDIIELVKYERRKHPKLGGRKLYAKLKELMLSMGIKMGRDKFFYY